LGEFGGGAFVGRGVFLLLRGGRVGAGGGLGFFVCHFGGWGGLLGGGWGCIHSREFGGGSAALGVMGE